MLAAILLCLSIPVFAEGDAEPIDPSIYRLENQKNTEERGFVIKDGAIYDLSGKFLSNVSEDGKLANGMYLDENFRVGYGRADWASDTIDRAVELNVVPVLLRYGYPDNINRYEFAAIAYNMLDKSGKITISTTDAPAKFTDTDSDEIKMLARMGIIYGKSESEFAPNEEITREEAAVILGRIADYVGITAENKSVPNYFDDEQISSWAKDDVYKLKRIGIMQGESAGEIEEEDYHINFNPHSEITKEQSIVTLMRIYDMIV